MQKRTPFLAALLSSGIAACGGGGDPRGAAGLSTAKEAVGSGDGAGFVYVLSNDPGGNAVLAFARASDGTLTPAGSFATGGTGTGAGLGSQGALAFTRDGRWLLAVNAGSDDVSIFSVTRAGGLELVDRAPSGGDTPISISVANGVAFVVNAGVPNNVSGLRIGPRGDLEPIPGSTRPLSADDSGPAQISFDPAGEALVVTEKTTNRISVYRTDGGGGIEGPRVFASSGQVPFGFAFTTTGVLVVSEAAASTVSSYRLNGDGLETVTASAPNFQAAACWIAIPDSSRYAYSANTGAGTISGYAVAEDGTLSLLDSDGVTAAAGAGPADLAFSSGSRFLYVRDGGDGSISGYRVQGDGGLEPVELESGLPAGSAGLVAR
jgi:6-phosphogluconolactonase